MNAAQAASPKIHPDIHDAIIQALEYFEDREDSVDGDWPDPPSANREMKLAQLCREALALIEASQ